MSAIAERVTIPSSASLNEVPPRRQTNAERRLGRALEERKTMATCPHCGSRATLETLTLRRPGQPEVQQVLVRCWQQGRRIEGQDRCPVTIISETAVAPPDVPQDGEQPAPYPQAEEVPQEAPGVPQAWMLGSPDHCQDCGAMLDPGHGRTYCEHCGRERRRAINREHMRRVRACQEEETMGKTRICADCGADISGRGPSAKRCEGCAGVSRKQERRDWQRHHRTQSISLIDLFKVGQGTSFSGQLVRAVLALSPERQDLLRRLLEDAEVPA